MSIWTRGTRIPEIYGTIMALGLIIYFFIMYAAGLIHVIELRLLNVLILLASVYYALRQWKRSHGGRLDYFNALTTGVATSAIGAGTFSVFILIYLHLDTNLMNSIAEKEPLGYHLNPYMASFAVSLEGIFSGLAVSYLLSNFLATDTAAVDHVADKLP